MPRATRDRIRTASNLTHRAQIEVTRAEAFAEGDDETKSDTQQATETKVDRPRRGGVELRVHTVLNREHLRSVGRTMANDDHVKILQTGVEAWNAWTRESWGAQEIKVDLSGADLSGLDLQDALFIGADLRDANLSRADLRRANFIAANMQGVHLTEGILEFANLSSANLSGAILCDADLYGANLYGVNFANADLYGALLDFSCVGEIHDAIGEKEFLKAKWSRVYIGEKAGFDPGHDPEDASYWLIRQGEETIRAACIRGIGRYQSADIIVNFRRSVWRELYLVEIGLREALGEGSFDVHRSEDHIAVTFESATDMRVGLESIVLMLSALEKCAEDFSLEPVVESLCVRHEEGQVLAIDVKEWRDLVTKINAIYERTPEQSSQLVEGVEALLESSPIGGPFLKYCGQRALSQKHSLREWFKKTIRQFGLMREIQDLD